jgi:serpin B
MLIMNATYFKADWMNKFNPRRTQDKYFYAPTSRKEVKTMSLTTKLKYFSNDQVEVVKLPYKGTASMMVILPKKNTDLQEIIKNLNLNWNSYQKDLELSAVAYGSLHMPKFSFRNDLKLNEALSNLGLSEIFGPTTPDFTNISPQNLKVSFIKQNSFIAVDEKGTEAAAVTTIGMERASVRPDLSFNMVVDRLFAFAIIQYETRSLLFLGMVNDPSTTP